MDLSQYLCFLSEAQRHRTSTLNILQPIALFVPHVIAQFEMVFGWYTAQTTAQFLASLEITRDYGDIPPELRPQILYLLNEMVQNRFSLEEFIYQLDQLYDCECPQIEEIFDGSEEGEEPEKKEDEASDEQDNEFDESKETFESESVHSKSEEFKIEEFKVEDFGVEETKPEESQSNEPESDEFKSDASNFEEPEHRRNLLRVNALRPQMTDQVVKAHFGQFGTVLEFTRAHDPIQTHQSRTFGFITYSSASMVDAAQQASPHTIKGRLVSARRDNSTVEDALKKRIQLAGLGEDLVEEDLKQYFVMYGNVVNVKILNKRSMQRGCAFVEFDDYDPVEWAVLERHHLIKGQVVEATKSLLKEEVDSVEREARGGGQRNVPAWEDADASRDYNRGGNGEYSRGDGGFNGQNSHQSQDWNRQPREQHQQGGQSSDYENSGYGNRTGGGPIRRPNNRLHSTSGPYQKRPSNHRW